MAFRREVPSLEQLVLKYISKAGKEVSDIITEETITRLHRISKPNKIRTNKVKQQLIHALLKNGRLGDDTLPACFFHESMAQIDLSGAKISSVLMEKVRLKNLAEPMTDALILVFGYLLEYPCSQLFGMFSSHR